MKCPVCGHESDGKFCENCGSPLTQNNTQENATNSVDSFGQNPTPEQPNYDYNTENQNYDQSNQIIISSTIRDTTTDTVILIKTAQATVSSLQIHKTATADSSLQMYRTVRRITAVKQP